MVRINHSRIIWRKAGKCLFWNRKEAFAVSGDAEPNICYTLNLKGTVPPDWIGMRVISLASRLKGHQPLHVFNSFVLSLIFYKSSKFWATPCKNESNLLLVRFTVCIESCLPIGWRTFIWWSAALFWLGLRNDKVFHSQAAIQRTIDASPAFMEYGLAKKNAAWAHANRKPNKQEDRIQFCMKRLRTLKSYKILKIKQKN